MTIPKTRRCNGAPKQGVVCGKILPLSEEYFHTSISARNGGFNYLCKECTRAKNRLRGSDTRRKYYIKSKYGISIDQYETMLIACKNVCAICEEEEKTVIAGKIIPLSVDHNHETGEIRNLLCSRCNTSLGHIEKYLKNSEWKSKIDRYLNVST